MIEEQHLARVYLRTEEKDIEFSKPYDELYPNLNHLKMMELQDSERIIRRTQAEREYREQKEKLRLLEELQARDYDIVKKGIVNTYEVFRSSRINHGIVSPIQHDDDHMGITKEELDSECENLFSDTPIRFIPRSMS